MCDMADPVVEIHVPLTPDPTVAEGEYEYPWILDVEEHLLDELKGPVEALDDGEEVGDEYLFFITGESEDHLLRVASMIATRPGVPAGAYAVVTDAEAEDFGVGRRVELPVPQKR